MKGKRNPQIGVLGSVVDLDFAKELEQAAKEVGAELAKAGATVMFGAEKDFDSLSTMAARGAREAGGMTVGVTYGKGLEIFDQADVVIATGLERGGGREFSLVLSCDAVIAINGGSGTLNELAVAYQAGIPMFVLENSGGWSEKLQGTFFDGRNRLKVESAKTPKELVELALRTHAPVSTERIAPA